MAEAVKARAFGSEALTDGVRIRAWPTYVPLRSDPEGRQFVFSYRIRVSNETDQPVTLLSRRWAIVDADGERHDVEGEGVVGRQPTILPGQSFEYTSYCPLPTQWGTMEGAYVMRRSRGISGGDQPVDIDDADAELFTVKVARFYLVSGQEEVVTA